MIAKSYSTSLDEYLKVSQVAQEFNLHPATVRRATNSGSLKTARSNGHQRLIQRRWIYEWLGIDPEEEDTPRAVLCVFRVSSRSQLTSLEKQKELTLGPPRCNRLPPPARFAIPSCAFTTRMWYIGWCAANVTLATA